MAGFFDGLSGYLGNMFGAGGTGLLQGPTAGGQTLDAAQSPGILDQFQAGVVNHRDALMGMGVGLLNSKDLRSGLAQGFANFNTGEKQDRKRTAAAAFAKSAKGLTPEQKQLLEDNPDIATEAAAKQIGDVLNPPTTADITNFAYDQAHGYTGTFHQWRLENSQSGGNGPFGNQVVWGMRNGKYVALQASHKGGGLEEAVLPPGVELTGPNTYLNTGTGFVAAPTRLLPGAAAGAAVPVTDPNQPAQSAVPAQQAPAASNAVPAPAPLAVGGGQSPVVSGRTIPIDNAGKVIAETTAKSYAEAVAAYPEAMRKFDQIDQLTQALIDDPRRAGSVGTISANLASGIPGTDTYNYRANLKKLAAENFGIAIQGMRGLGSLSNAEGLKVSDAIANLDPGQSDDDFKRQLIGVQDAMREYRRVATIEAQRGGPASMVPTQATPGSPGTEGGRGYSVIKVH